MNIEIHELSDHTVEAAGHLHARRSEVGLHSLLGSKFLTFFYESLVNNPDVKVFVARVNEQVVGVGYLVFNPLFLRKLIWNHPLKFFLLLMIRFPILCFQPRRTLSAIRAILAGGASGSIQAQQSDCVELGFIVTEPIKNAPAAIISKKIFISLKNFAKIHGYKKINSVVSRGHKSSVFMHSVLNFKQVSISDRFILYSLDI